MTGADQIATFPYMSNVAGYRQINCIRPSMWNGIPVSKNLFLGRRIVENDFTIQGVSIERYINSKPSMRKLVLLPWSADSSLY